MKGIAESEMAYPLALVALVGCSSTLRMSDSSRRLVVIANDAAVEAVLTRDAIDFGIPPVRLGNNHPERRRNLLIDSLQEHMIGASIAEDLSDAMLVHSSGYVYFYETAFERWKTELKSDPSYLLPGTSMDTPALVPFHCTKTMEPRDHGLAAEFACYASDFETPIFEGTSITLREDLGVVRACVAHLASLPTEAQGVAYALTVHPGHHAGPSYSSGFCYINNACVACCMCRDLGLEAALLDLDFHGGNGSFDCCLASTGRFGAARPPAQWFRSLHCASSYPWVTMGDAGIELPQGSRWHDCYGPALDAVLSSLPDTASVLVVSLGFDTLATDPESAKRSKGLCLEPDDFFAMGVALARTGRKVLIVQEGGYDLSNVPRAATELVAGLGDAMREVSMR